jgi:hypothetical protein
MTPARGFWAYWFFTVPNVILLVVTGLLVARCVLSLVLRDDTIVMRILRVVTGPVYVPVAAITPRVVPQPIVALIAIVWIYVLRIILYFATLTMG